mmetsp:Transcript_16830/g.37359  ORF Transcript_16830/g.37359 Transcript_16830/m.37359 type:complete len:237 (-) Transcript_16830:376-1086(-)
MHICMISTCFPLQLSPNRLTRRLVLYFSHQLLQLAQRLLPGIVFATDHPRGVARDILGLAHGELGVGPFLVALQVLQILEGLLAQLLLLVVAVAAPVGPIHLGVELGHARGQLQSLRRAARRDARRLLFLRGLLCSHLREHLPGHRGAGLRRLGGDRRGRVEEQGTRDYSHDHGAAGDSCPGLVGHQPRVIGDGSHGGGDGGAGIAEVAAGVDDRDQQSKQVAREGGHGRDQEQQV